MIHIYFILFLFLVAFVFAKVEVSIEGENGWAKDLPTWRLGEKKLISRLFFGGRPATGYHVWINIFVFSILHFAYFFTEFQFKAELQVLSFFFLFWVFEDFLWFVINPAFGLNKFKKEEIWWHEKRWFLFAPVEYFIFIPISIVLYLFSI